MKCKMDYILTFNAQKRLINKLNIVPNIHLLISNVWLAKITTLFKMVFAFLELFKIVSYMITRACANNV